MKNRASDIQIEPEADRPRVRYRIDGVLYEAMSLDLDARAPLISRLKILGGMNIADHLPQDGQFSVRSRKKREVNVRVATISTVHGEMAVLRILDKSFAALALDELGRDLTCGGTAASAAGDRCTCLKDMITKLEPSGFPFKVRYR